jgi:hypothetical protein
MDLRRTAQVVEVVEVVGAILPDEFNIVIQPGTADGFNDGRPGGVDMGGQGWLARLE